MRFDCIVIDPPWQYRNKNTGGSLISGADKKYPTLSFIELLNLQESIHRISKANSIMFMWITNPFLREGLSLLEAYGFEYKTLITWVKNGKGLGHWYRGNTEHLLVGIKGEVKAFHSQNINVFHADTREHSQKPIKAYELIDDATKTISNCKTLEIFARKHYRDWICIGLHLDGLDVFDALDQIASR